MEESSLTQKIDTNILSQNRAEEFGYDLSDSFVVPPYFVDLDFKTSSKPKVFQGGRGCGKTMLLRFLSHKTMFSKTKKNISEDELTNVGLYWKVDTHLSQQLQKRGLDQDVWDSAFEHIFTLHFAVELIDSVKSISESSYVHFSEDQFKSLLLNFNSDSPLFLSNKIVELNEMLFEKIEEFEFWLKNVRKNQIPTFFPKHFLSQLIKQLISQVPSLKNSVFNFFIDEYENLTDYQKVIVNTWVKHSEKPMVFHIAMKRNAFKNKRTSGSESLSDIHDYRIHDLEHLIGGKRGFLVFAAEIILYRLRNHVAIGDLGELLGNLGNPQHFEERKSPKYQDKIAELINSIFPSKSHKEMAIDIIQDTMLEKRLYEKISSLLKKRRSDIDAKLFFCELDPRITCTCTVLLARENLQADEILSEIEKFKRGESNKFTGETGWVSNNFIGAYLLFYSTLNRVCPLYTGFSTFCEISSGNIRHLSELCYKSLLRASDRLNDDAKSKKFNVSIDEQAQAARQASTTFLNEIKTFGQYGNQLHIFAHRLGALFTLAHKNTKQSEPEQNHFTIIDKFTNNEKVEDLISESLKWSVLIETQSTKMKSNSSTDLFDYVLNPIYSPYFHISYRKKRKIELKYQDLSDLVMGSINDFERILKHYKQRWNIDDNIIENDLFSNLQLE